MKLLHIIPDEKFSLLADSIFEGAFPGSNKFLVYQLSNDGPLVHQHPENSITVRRNEEGKRIILEEIPKYGVVVLHSFKPFISELLGAVHLPGVLIWSFWGYEIYNDHKLLRKQWSTAFSRSLQFKGLKRITTRLRLDRKTGFPSLLFGKADPAKRSLLRQVGAVATFIDGDVAMLKHHGLLSANCSRVRFNYYSLEDITSGFDSAVPLGNSVLLGNSAFPTNNHAEILPLLSKALTPDRTVRVPLSYGNDNYRKEIITLGNTILGQRFAPITDFVPLAEYNNKLADCGFVVMNHLRQQALGNLTFMLWRGCRVFLRQENSLYAYFKGLGMLIQSVADLRKNPRLLSRFLTEDEKLANRKILEEVFSRAAIIRQLREDVQNLAQEYESAESRS